MLSPVRPIAHLKKSENTRSDESFERRELEEALRESAIRIRQLSQQLEQHASRGTRQQQTIEIQKQALLQQQVQIRQLEKNQKLALEELSKVRTDLKAAKSLAHLDAILIEFQKLDQQQREDFHKKSLEHAKTLQQLHREKRRNIDLEVKCASRTAETRELSESLLEKNIRLSHTSEKLGRIAEKLKILISSGPQNSELLREIERLMECHDDLCASEPAEEGR